VNKFLDDNFTELQRRAKLLKFPDYYLVLKICHHLLWHIGSGREWHQGKFDRFLMLFAQITGVRRIKD
jgi:hypothetical protein